MSYTVEFIENAQRGNRRKCRAIVKRLCGVVRIDHELQIKFAPAEAVGVQSKHQVYEGLGFGVFVAPRRKQNRHPIIGIGLDESRKVRDLEHTLAHELAHYEQWRDGKELTERGVNVRAKNLVRKARGE